MQNRPITLHHGVDGINESLRIEPGTPQKDGVSYTYAIFAKSPDSNYEDNVAKIQFQQGKWGEKNSTQGVTPEAVIATLIDHLNSLGQSNPAREYSLAITKLQESLMWLQQKDRQQFQSKIITQTQSQSGKQ